MNDLEIGGYRPDLYNYIVSIDVGIKHLSLVLISISKEFQFREVIWFDLIDITDFIHLNGKKDCPLHHDKTCYDYMEHVFYLHHNLFSIANWILIERQPPMGLVVIEQLIFGKYREKAILISPNAMHKFMNWRDCNYEQRKVKSEEFALHILKYNQRDDLIKCFYEQSRAHDIADAICQFFYWIDCERKKWLILEKYKYDVILNEENRKAFNFTKYIYIPKVE